jgi:hypothetical protein
LWLQDSQGKKVCETLSKEKSCVWWLTTVIPGIAGTLKKEYHGPGWTEQKNLPQK